VDGLKSNGYTTMISCNEASDLQTTLCERRSRLAEQLVDAIQQPLFRSKELRLTIIDLDKLGDGTCAHTLLLQSHYERLQHNIRSLYPSGTSYGGAYIVALF
jgi:hypothetical protein